MCGITGIFDTKGLDRIDPNTLSKMSHKIFHRGPDASAIFCKDNIGLGFQRLSIVDIEHGMQPMFNTDRTIVSVCNGEIYNYKELRAELISKNHKFTTNADVEVLTHLYEEYGSNFINKLNGQFAFVIYDMTKKRLIAARDHFGIAPFFYCLVDNLFIFGSEIKAILEHPLVKREVNLVGLDQIFTFPGLISPTTMFKNIHSLPGGHYLDMSCGDNAPTIVEYWDLIYPKVGEISYHPDENYYLENLTELLKKAVKYRLNADVPVGFYVSGGLDSSIILSLAKNIFPSKIQKTFSVVFPHSAQISESVYQQMMSEHCETQHCEYPFTEQDIGDRIRKVIYHTECPLKESYNTAAIALSENVKKNNIKVILAGQGADEFFAGYPGYKFDHQLLNGLIKGDMDEADLKLNLQIWGDSKFYYEKRLHTFGLEKFKLYSEQVNYNRKDVDSLNHFVIQKERLMNIDPIHRRSYIDFKLRLSDHLLGDHGDRMVLANSVEGRYPFLDQEFVEFVKKVPPYLKLRDLNEKYILKKLSQDILPKKIIDREKFGFTAPGSAYLIKQNNEYIHEMLSVDNIKKQGYFNPKVIEELKVKYMHPDFKINATYESDLLMTVLTFNIFLKEFNLPNYS